MNKQELLKYAESQWPNESFGKKKLTKQQLLYSVASRTYPEATLNKVALVEDKPYVITHLFGPGHNVSDSSDETQGGRMMKMCLTNMPFRWRNLKNGLLNNK